MKVRLFFTVLMIFGLLFAGCSDSDSGGTSSGNEVYTTTEGGTTYKLTIAQNRAAVGNSYTLVISGNTNGTSTGTISAVSGTTFTLKPSKGGELTIVISGSGITSIQGTVTFDDGEVDTIAFITINGNWGKETESSYDDYGYFNSAYKVEFKFNNGNFEWRDSDPEGYRGTYTTDGSIITFRINSVYMSADGSFPDEYWYSKDQAMLRMPSLSAYLFEPGESYYSISSDTLTFTYIRGYLNIFGSTYYRQK